MTAYTKSTNFATKDTLTSGDPLKIVKGTEINTEFDNIATAVNSKSNTDSPTFTGTVTIPTLSYAGTTLTAAVTGTGKMVLDTSPTLVTPILGTPTSGTVTNLTGTASININGTVGATTANTGAFTTLSATGVTTVQAGTAALPAITTTGDTNTGIFFPAADTIAFTEGGAEAMRIDSSGNLLINTTTLSNDEKVTINQGSAIGISVRSTSTALGNYESSDTGHSTYWTFGRDNVTTGNFVFATNGTLRGSINLSTGTYTASSDSRLKKNITNITYGLSEVMAMRPVTYLMNEEEDTAKKHLGFIAQEVKALVDEAVDDLIDPDTQFYMLDKGGLVPVLTKAIQEQQALITALTARITALEAK